MRVEVLVRVRTPAEVATDLLEVAGRERLARLVLAKGDLHPIVRETIERLLSVLSGDRASLRRELERARARARGAS